jgi:hypothetical protein
VLVVTVALEVTVVPVVMGHRQARVALAEPPVQEAQVLWAVLRMPAVLPDIT